MDPTVLTNLALVLLNQILQLIATIRSTGGISDDQLTTRVQQITQGNDQLYTTMMGALGLSSTK